MVMEARFKAISAMRNIHLSAKRSPTQLISKCTLFNGIDQRSSELQGFCSLLRLIRAFLGNDAHTAITSTAI